MLMRPPVAEGRHEFSSTDLPIDFDQDGPPTVQPTTEGPATLQPAAHTEPMEMGGDTARQPHEAGAARDLPFEVSDFDLDTSHVEVPTIPDVAEPVHAHAPAPAAGAPSIDFDFGDLSLDLDKPATSVEAADELPDLDMDSTHGDTEPMARKIELADEFRRIGDHEGARELLEEVVSKADGPLKSRAQTMLDALG